MVANIPKPMMMHQIPHQKEVAQTLINTRVAQEIQQKEDAVLQLSKIWPFYK